MAKRPALDSGNLLQTLGDAHHRASGRFAYAHVLLGHTVSHDGLSQGEPVVVDPQAIKLLEVLGLIRSTLGSGPVHGRDTFFELTPAGLAEYEQLRSSS